MASTALMGVFGFGFWVLCARLFDAQAVGVGSSLVSATSIISYLAMLGFNTTFVAFVPRSADPEREVNTAFNIVLVTAVVISLAYALGAPLFAGELAVLHSTSLNVAVFVVLTTAAAANLLTDSFFIAYRSARYNFLVDGIVQSSIKLALPLALVTGGALGIFTSSGVAALVGVGLSLILMVRHFGYRYRPIIDVGVVRATFAYSASSYVSSLLNLLPQLVLPVIVLRAQGAAETGFYFVAFQIANLPNGVSYAISQSLFAEGSQPGADVMALARRSARLNAAVLLPGIALCVLAARLVLAPFGVTYAAHAAGTLTWFALGCLTVALNVWASVLLRLVHRLELLVWSNVVFVVVTCGLSLWLAPLGTVWVAVAWLAGNLVSGSISLAGFVAAVRPGAPPARRRDAPTP
jgi:O-antigen/teichoic acid export membrane protein